MVHRLTWFPRHAPSLPTIPDYGDQGQPKATSLINVNVTCDGWVGEGEDGMGESSSASSSSPCSDGSCLDSDFGVYCLCYVRESNQEEVPCEHHWDPSP